MPDISMCMDERCPVRTTCYRNEASGTKPNPWRQAYAPFGINGRGPCLDYVPIEPAPPGVQKEDHHG